MLSAPKLAFMPRTLPQQVAKRVKHELAATGRTQRELAEHLKVSNPMISYRLAGRYSFPLHELPAVAEFFGITVADLLDENRPQQAAS